MPRAKNLEWTPVDGRFDTHEVQLQWETFESDKPTFVTVVARVYPFVAAPHAHAPKGTHYAQIDWGGRVERSKQPLKNLAAAKDWCARRLYVVKPE